MALIDLLEQHGVSAADPDAVYDLLRRLPIAPRSKVQWWEEYARERGLVVTTLERETLSV